jgi:hypothetical protein
MSETKKGKTQTMISNFLYIEKKDAAILYSYHVQLMKGGCRR